MNEALQDIYIGRLGTQLVCLKVPRIGLEDSQQEKEKAIREFHKEALLWIQLRHVNLLPFFGVNTSLFPDKLCLVSPFMENGRIIAYLKNHPNHDRLTVITEIAAGMSYLHSLKILHGDIKGANVLVNGERQCQLADFGLALTVEMTLSNSTTGGMKGSFNWMAPELFSSALDKEFAQSLGYHVETKPNKLARDVYAFGCTVLEVISGSPPFTRLNGPTIMLQVLHGKRPERPITVNWCPDDIWELVEQCWAQEVRFRPSAGEIHDLLRRLLGHTTDGDIREAMLDRYSFEEMLRSTLPPEKSKLIANLLQSEILATDCCKIRKKYTKFLRHLFESNQVLPDSIILNEIELFECSIGRPIGGGGFSDIYKGNHRGKVVCLKLLRTFAFEDQNRTRLNIDKLCEEALLWSQLDHPNVLPFCGVNTELFTRPSFCLVSPWMINGSVTQYLARNPCHDKLRVANILVDENSCCRLAGFGLAKATAEISSDLTSHTQGGTARYMAPELLVPTGVKPDFPGDVYAYGCSVYEIISGKPPFWGWNEAAVILKVAFGKNARPSRPANVAWCPDDIWALVERCWQKSAAARPP
ncbi:hypothetical protein V5O48_014589, partial [Marasmius crinis-equi]